MSEELQETPQVQTAEEALAGLFEADMELSSDTIHVTSNSGSSVAIEASEPMSVGDVLVQSGISLRKDTQVMVDGTPVADDHIVSPGTEIYLHRMVQGG